MRISDWSSDVCSSDLRHQLERFSTFATPSTAAQSSGFSPGKIAKSNPLPMNFCAERAARHRSGWVFSQSSNLLLSIRWREWAAWPWSRSEEHTSELQSLMRISYAVFCLKKKKTQTNTHD